LAPLLFRHATLAYANLPLAFYLFAGVYLLSRAFAAHSAPVAQRAAAGAGVFLAAAAWTRPEGLALAFLTLLVGLGLARRGHRIAAGRLALAAGMPLAGYLAFWGWLWLRVYALAPGGDGLTSQALAGMTNGSLHLAEAGHILQAALRGLADPSNWGILGILILAAPAAAWRAGVRRAPFASLLLACGLAYALAVLGIYYVTSYSPVHDIRWWVSTGLERMLFPALVCLWSGAVGSLRAFHRDPNSGDRSGAAPDGPALP
jgi:hypothetical protein